METNDQSTEKKLVKEKELADTKDKNQEKWIYFLGIFVISTIYVGSVTIAGVCDKSIFAEKIENKNEIKFFGNFMHPMFLTLNMFIGMSFLNIVYFIKRCFQKNPEPLPSFHVFLLMCIPSFLDNFFTSILLYGRMITAPSVNRTLGSIQLVGNMVLSYLLLKTKYSVQTRIGSFVIILGSTIVGFSAIKEKGLGENSFVGLSILLFTYIFCNFQFILEEYLLKNPTIIKPDPMLLVGIEGITGVIYGFTFLAIGNMIPCQPFGDSNFALCAYGYIENINIAIQQFNLQPKILYFFLIHLISLGIFNYTALLLSKLINSTFRSILQFLNVILIWIHSVLVGWETLKPLQVLGYSIVILGVLVFQEIMDFNLFNKYNTKNVSKKKSD